MQVLSTSIPARLDRLPWSGWHWRVVIALGVSWLLDGLEVTLVGSIGPALQRPDTLGLSASAIGWAASAYIGGAVLGLRQPVQNEDAPVIGPDGDLCLDRQDLDVHQGSLGGVPDDPHDDGSLLRCHLASRYKAN